jgi:hypothetical protein
MDGCLADVWGQSENLPVFPVQRENFTQVFTLTPRLTGLGSDPFFPAVAWAGFEYFRPARQIDVVIAHGCFYVYPCIKNLKNHHAK